jgi:hypothetical protein
MFKWKKLGKVFTPQEVEGRPWLREFAQGPATLIYGEYIRVYFSCRPEADLDGKYVSYCAYVDLDRKNPLKVLRVAEKPIFDLGGLGEFDEFGTYIMSVIHDGRLIRAYYAGITRGVSVPLYTNIGMATSLDGKTFVKFGRGPVLANSPHEPFVLSGPKIRKFNDRFYLYYIAGRKWKMMDGRPEPVYKIRMATSLDGIEWKRENKDLIPSVLEKDEAQSGPDVIYANGKFHMFFCYRPSGNHRGRKNGLRIGYASSHDAFHWERDDSKAGITVSDEGWDSEMVRYPHVFFLEGSTYMLYNGNEFGRNGFGLAVLEGAL